MIQTVIKPTEAKFSLPIPETYAGKEIAVLVYALDEATSVPDNNASAVEVDMSAFAGSLKMSQKEYEEFLAFIEEGRSE